MRKLSVFTFSLLLLVTSVPVSAQQESKDFASDVDRFVRKTLEKIPDVPGLAIVVIKDDKPIFVRAYGMADREGGKKADENTLWYIASSNKAFTALAAAMLDKDGKIRLADPVAKYAVGIKFKTPIPERVTIRDLLTHTSGLRNEALIHRTAFTGQIDKNEIDRVLAEATTVDEPNVGKYRYTNLGYNIYSILLENNLEIRWQDLLQKRIFDPAGLKHTTAVISRASAKKWNVASNYVFDENVGGIVRSRLPKKDANMQAAGGMFMSVGDLGRWLNLNMNAGRLGGKQILPAELITVAHTPYTRSTRNEPPFSGDGDYGLGWQIGKYGDDKVIYHHGGYSGYRSHVSFMPDRKIAVGILVNNDVAGGRVADTIAVYAYDWWKKSGNLDANYDKQIDDFVKQYETRKEQMIGSAAERAKRPSQLSEPLEAYVGKYTNELLGTIEVLVEGKYLAVRTGLMYSPATPFTEKDTIRVVLNLQGSGEVIGFQKGSDNKIAVLRYAGRDFRRVGS